MTDALLISVDPGETRTALLRDGVLTEYAIERSDAASLVGNIYLGRVTRVVPAIDAAFVDCGLGRAGFLAGSDGPPGDGPLARRVHEGEVLTVQVNRDPVAEKGPRVTTRLSLAGRLVVLCPGTEGVAVSRRITDADERLRLTRGVEGAARAAQATIIVRTAAEGCDIRDLTDDLDILVENARDLRAKAGAMRAPARLRAELGPVERALRDRVSSTDGTIIVDDRTALNHARAFAADHCPDALDRLKSHSGPVPLFRAHDLEEQIAELFEPRIVLPSGGALIIEATEAMTVIDVDSAGHTLRSTSKSQETAAINIEAAREVARQIRLRDIGGPIVVDFIGMADDASRQQVVDTLTQAVQADPTPVRLTGMSAFGMVEMTRKRMRPSLADLLTERCPACAGGGRVKTVRTIAGEILRAGLLEAASGAGRSLTVVAAPLVVDALRTRHADFVDRLERASGAPVALTAEGHMPRDQYEIAVGLRRVALDGKGDSDSCSRAIRHNRHERRTMGKPESHPIARFPESRRDAIAPARPCPVCGADAVAARHPFCSSRCQDVDLGRWLKGNYAIPGRPAGFGEEDD